MNYSLSLSHFLSFSLSLFQFLSLSFFIRREKKIEREGKEMMMKRCWNESEVDSFFFFFLSFSESEKKKQEGKRKKKKIHSSLTLINHQHGFLFFLSERKTFFFTLFLPSFVLP